MADRRLLTNQEVVALIEAETGTTITSATFRSYVARGQAPSPIERRAGSPFYSRKQILEWIHNRPGSGARTDIPKSKPTRTSPIQSPRKQPRSSPAATEEAAQAAPAAAPQKRSRRAPAKDAAVREQAKAAGR